MLISPSPATLERHTDALLLAATTDDAHDDAQPVRRAALEALNVLDLRLVEQYAARRGAECVASFRFLAALDPVETPSTTIGRQRAYLAKKGAKVVETKTETAAAPDGGAGMFGGIFGFLSGGQAAQAGTEAAASRVKHIRHFSDKSQDYNHT